MSTKTEKLRRRDNFAALAMQALIIKGGNATQREIAESAAKQADELIKVLNNQA